MSQNEETPGQLPESPAAKAPAAQRKLVTGGDDPFLPHLSQAMARATEIDIGRLAAVEGRIHENGIVIIFREAGGDIVPMKSGFFGVVCEVFAGAFERARIGFVEIDVRDLIADIKCRS